MIQAFISHSSVQKKFAEDVVSQIGRSNCIIDCYDFQPGYRTIDEINAKISKSTIFVLLISKESLSSRWVQYEMNLAREKYKETPNRFYPVIIDDTDWRDCPDWISKEQCYNLKKFKTPYAVAREIEYRFRKLESPLCRSLREVIGRNSDIDLFEKIYYSKRRQALRCGIISGRNGVGREAFANQCLQKIKSNQDIEPLKIQLSQESGIEEFIKFLNDLTGMYSSSNLIAKLGTSLSEKVETAVALINETYNNYNTPICIYDDGACVQYNRELSSWLSSIIKHEKLVSLLGLFIISSVSPSSYITSIYPEIIHIALQPLNREDRKKLFYHLADSYGILNKIQEEDVNFFVDKLLYSPQQLYKAVEVIQTSTLCSAKREIKSLIEIGDSDLRSLITDYKKKSDLHWEVLISLSLFEFISYYIFERFFDGESDELHKIFDDLMVRGIIYRFGLSEQFVKMDHSLRDYIKRARISPPSDLKAHIEDVLEQELDTDQRIEDTSLYLYDIQKKVRKNTGNLGEVLFPSIIIKSIKDAYENKRYDDVLLMCQSVRENAYDRFFPETLREVTYWYCLSLARGQDAVFWDIVKEIHDPADQYFLKGFYYRNGHNYSEAESYFRRSLERSPNMQRSQRELVTALMEQGKFSSAINLAKNNYERNPTNSYHIYAYFRCEIQYKKGKDLNIDLLKKLIKELEFGYSNKQEELLMAMNLELNLYAIECTKEAAHKLINKAQQEFPYSETIKKVIGDYQRQ